VDPAAEQDGLARSQLQTEVELRLRHAGIPVGPTLRHLYVNVDTERSDRGQTYAYHVAVQYVQQVVLARTPSAHFRHHVGHGWGRPDRCQSPPRGAPGCGQLCGQFIKAYLEQNPSSN